MLLVTGTVFITVVEWTNRATLGVLPPAELILASFFQSVITRTAGRPSWREHPPSKMWDSSITRLLPTGITAVNTQSRPRVNSFFSDQRTCPACDPCSSSLALTAVTMGT